MRIIAHRALRGPNYYSRYPTMYMLLDIEELEKTPSDRIPGFNQRLMKLLPSLRDHRCSPGYVGGFLERLERGTWAAHIVEHIVIELQVLAGMEVGFGKTHETKEQGVYSVVYRYRDEEAGIEAGRAAVDIVESLVQHKPVDLEAILARLRDIKESNLFGPSTRGIVDEARRRGIPVIRLDRGSYIQLGHGVHQRRMQATLTDRTSTIGVEIADDKKRTKEILAEAGIAVPRGETVRSYDDAVEAAERIGFPVVVKPLSGNHGRGITTHVKTVEELGEAYDLARTVNRDIIIEKHLVGADFRLLVVNRRFVAAARRDPAHVIGDGESTVRQLVDAVNADPRRGHGHEKVLTRIEPDEQTGHLLAEQGLTLDDVPAAGLLVTLKSTANISSGGTATDVTDDVHPAVRLMAERVSRIVDLDVMGIDIVAPDLHRPLNESGGGIVEVNAAPGLRMHIEPAAGKARNVAGPILDMLFPDGRKGAIPIVAITGTNGKTTTARLISHILKYNGARVGMTSTGAVEINNHVILEGDYSGPDGAKVVLRDSSVDHAVLEVARGGILRRGLGFDECDVGIFLNVATDHLGEGEIETIEDLARLKGVVVDAVRTGGTAVLNAEDPYVVAYKDRLRAQVVLFALDPADPHVLQHLEDGGNAVTVNNGYVVLRHGASEFQFTQVRDIPVTIEGKALFNVQNVLAAVAAAHALGVPDDVICTGLMTFNPTVGQLPGRMNIIELDSFRVLIDYGHNAAALRALAQVVPHLTRSGRIIAMANASGNRRDEDLRAFGGELANMYHHVILCDPDPRGREPGETCDIVRDGLRAGGFPDENLQIILAEPEAIDAALAMANEGDLVVLQADDVKNTIRKIRGAQDAAGAKTGVPRAPMGALPGERHHLV